MAINYSNDYKIYVNKDIPTGDSPFSPKNPSHPMTKNPEVSASRDLNFGIGMIAARRGVGLITSELRKDGNEQTAIMLGNVSNAIGRGILIMKSPKVALAAMGTEGIIQTVVEIRERKRENIATQINNKLLGNRVDVGRGGSIYD